MSLDRRTAAALAVGPVLGAARALTMSASAYARIALVAAPALLAAAIALHMTSRAMLALAAGLVAGLWGPVHEAPLVTALLALGPAVTLYSGRLGRWVQALLAGLIAAVGAALILAPGPGVAIAIALAGVGAALVAVLRPGFPTAGQRAFLRTGALFVPALGLGALLAANAVLGLGEARSVRTVLELGVGLAGVLALLGSALLGLAVLLASDDELQGGAWAAMSAGAGVIAGTLPARDPSLTIETLAVLAVPVAVLAAIALGRQHRDGPGPAWIAGLALAVALAAQLGL